MIMAEIPEKVKEYLILEGKYWKDFWSYEEPFPPSIEKEMEEIKRKMEELKKFPEVQEFLKGREERQKRRWEEFRDTVLKEAFKGCSEEEKLGLENFVSCVIEKIEKEES